MKTLTEKPPFGKSSRAWSQSHPRDYIVVRPGTNIALSKEVFNDPHRCEKGYTSETNHEAAVAEAGRLGGVVASAAWVIRKFGNVIYP